MTHSIHHNINQKQKTKPTRTCSHLPTWQHPLSILLTSFSALLDPRSLVWIFFLNLHFVKKRKHLIYFIRSSHSPYLSYPQGFILSFFLLLLVLTHIRYPNFKNFKICKLFNPVWLVITPIFTLLSSLTSWFGAKVQVWIKKNYLMVSFKIFCFNSLVWWT